MEILCDQNSILLNSKQYGTDIEFYRIKKYWRHTWTDIYIIKMVPYNAKKVPT